MIWVKTPRDDSRLFKLTAKLTRMEGRMANGIKANGTGVLIVPVK